jgi:ribosomal protein S18 acetylase RimI-like enzyme
MVTYRPIVAPDATTIARIHATSWRSAYRGILPDEYLDGDIDADRLTHWRRRLSAPTQRDVGVLALQAGAPVGFGFAVRDDDEFWGSMLDNLHVLPEHKGHGFGRGLMRELVAQLAEAGTTAGLYLWVYEANAGACRFYERLSAVRLHAEVVDTAGGGRARALVYGWPTMEALKKALSLRIAP